MAESWKDLLLSAIENQLVIGFDITEEHIDLCLKARALFKKYNARFYNSELPPTNIFHSVCCGGEITAEYLNEPLNDWYNTSGEHCIILNLDVIQDVTQLKEVVLHEMAHEYCDIHGITDIEPGWPPRHTEAFAKVCREHGLAYKAGETDFGQTMLQ